MGSIYTSHLKKLDGIDKAEKATKIASCRLLCVIKKNIILDINPIKTKFMLLYILIMIRTSP